MDSRYSYDEHSETWPVFALAVLSVTVVPVSIGAVSGLLQGGAKSDSQVKGYIQHSKTPKNIDAYKKRTSRSKWFTKKNIFLFLGWISIALLAKHISNTEIRPDVNTFDPYEILGIDYGSTDKEIRSHFRKLSVKFHPDKIKSDVGEEEKKELEEKFVLISKAYKALTDEVIKENYEKYGHPDGPQQASHGIALPKFLIEGKSSPFLLVLYIVLIGLVLPIIVSQWWTQTKSYTKRGIHNDTANLFVENLLNYSPSNITTVDDIKDYLSDTYELQQFGLSKEEIIVVFDKHLARKELNNKELRIISLVPHLINGLVDISASFRNTDVSLIAIETLKHFIQALPENPRNELLQLPNVDPSAVSKSNIVRLGKLLTLPKDKIQEILGIKNDDKLKEALDVATKIPTLKLVKAEFKVPGESVVTPASNSYISVKVLVKSPKHHGEAPLNESKLKEEETLEALRDPYKIMNDQPVLPKAYAPYFPIDKNANYIGFVVLQKDGKITEVPTIFENLDLSNLELSESEYKDGSKLTYGTLKFQISTPTPDQPGKYQFRIIIKSLDYFTPDLDTSVIMNVENPPRLEEVDYDIPDPEEDSIAGALATMKGEKVSKIDNESDDEESDFEEGEESDFTDINTDTEDEGEN